MAQLHQQDSSDHSWSGPGSSPCGPSGGIDGIAAHLSEVDGESGWKTVACKRRIAGAKHLLSVPGRSGLLGDHSIFGRLGLNCRDHSKPYLGD